MFGNKTLCNFSIILILNGNEMKWNIFFLIYNFKKLQQFQVIPENKAQGNL